MRLKLSLLLFDVMSESLELLLEEIESISREIHSLIKQGVFFLVEKRLKTRENLIQDFFSSQTRSKINQSHQIRLGKILTDDKSLVKILNEQQQCYSQRQRGQKVLELYYQNKISTD